MRYTTEKTGRALAAAFLLITGPAVSFAACSSDSATGPSGPTLTTSSSSTSGGGSDATSTTTGTGGAGAGGSGQGGGAGGSGQGGAGGVVDCDGPDGCYDCAPQTGEQFLNACTDVQCAAFDNEARLPLYNHGNLPAIP